MIVAPSLRGKNRGKKFLPCFDRLKIPDGLASYFLSKMRQSEALVLLSACTASCNVLRRGNDTAKFDPLIYVDPLIGTANGGMHFAFQPAHLLGSSANLPDQVMSLPAQRFRMVRTRDIHLSIFSLDK